MSESAEYEAVACCLSNRAPRHAVFRAAHDLAVLVGCRNPSELSFRPIRALVMAELYPLDYPDDAATMKAFNLDKSTFYSWKRSLYGSRTEYSIFGRSNSQTRAPSPPSCAPSHPPGRSPPPSPPPSPPASPSSSPLPPGSPPGDEPVPELPEGLPPPLVPATGTPSAPKVSLEEPRTEGLPSGYLPYTAGDLQCGNDVPRADLVSQLAALDQVMQTNEAAAAEAVAEVDRAKQASKAQISRSAAAESASRAREEVARQAAAECEERLLLLQEQLDHAKAKADESVERNEAELRQQRHLLSVEASKLSSASQLSERQKGDALKGLQEAEKARLAAEQTLSEVREENRRLAAESAAKEAGAIADGLDHASVTTTAQATIALLNARLGEANRKLNEDADNTAKLAQELALHEDAARERDEQEAHESSLAAAAAVEAEEAANAAEGNRSDPGSSSSAPEGTTPANVTGRALIGLPPTGSDGPEWTRVTHGGRGGPSLRGGARGGHGRSSMRSSSHTGRPTRQVDNTVVAYDQPVWPPLGLDHASYQDSLEPALERIRLTMEAASIRSQEGLQASLQAALEATRAMHSAHQQKDSSSSARAAPSAARAEISTPRSTDDDVPLPPNLTSEPHPTPAEANIGRPRGWTTPSRPISDRGIPFNVPQRNFTLAWCAHENSKMWRLTLAQHFPDVESLLRMDLGKEFAYVDRNLIIPHRQDIIACKDFNDMPHIKYVRALAIRALYPVDGRSHEHAPADGCSNVGSVDGDSESHFGDGSSVAGGHDPPRRHYRGFSDETILSDCATSRDHRVLILVLAAEVDQSGRRWHHRTIDTPEVHQAIGRRVRETDSVNAEKLMRGIQTIVVPDDMRGSNSEDAADAYNKWRPKLASAIRTALKGGVDWIEILRETAIRMDESNGHPQLYLTFNSAMEDEHLLRYPAVHGDVLLWRCDDDFSGSSKYSVDYNQLAWINFKSRERGELLIGLFEKGVDYFVKYKNDPNVSRDTIPNSMNDRREVAQRLREALLDDKLNKRRGQDLSQRFWQIWCERLAEVTSNTGRASELLNLPELARAKLVPYETSAAGTWGEDDPDPVGSSAHVAAAQYAPRRQVAPTVRPDAPSVHDSRVAAIGAPSAETAPTGRAPRGAAAPGNPAVAQIGAPNDSDHVRGTSIKGRNGKAKANATATVAVRLLGRNQQGEPNDGELRGLYRKAKSTNDSARVAAIDQMVDQEAATAGAVSGNAPYVAKAKLPRATETGVRKFARPHNRIGNMPEAMLWDDTAWSKTYIDFRRMEEGAETDNAKALAKARPNDKTCTTLCRVMPRSVDNAWPIDSCKYCYYRPRAPANCPEKLLWFYGTGDGGHHPYRCQACQRYLASGGDEKFDTPTQREYLRSCVQIRDWNAQPR